MIRGRFAPSPSGEMHLGNAWVALLAWLQVRSAKGQMILRIEDLDPDRSRTQYVSQIIKDLKWLGLDWDEGPDCSGKYGPYIQSERHEFYKAAICELQAKELAYPCFCTRADIRTASSAPHGLPGFKYPGTCRLLRADVSSNHVHSGRAHALRFLLPEKYVEFFDWGIGETCRFYLPELGDFIVLRRDGAYAYQLAVVIDDAAMKISHVLRGRDLLQATAYQIALYEALDLAVPVFTHVPVLYGEDGQKLSKRHGDLSLHSLRLAGVPAERIIGHLGFWAGMLPKPEGVNAQELSSVFSLAQLPGSDLIITAEKLSGLRP